MEEQRRPDHGDQRVGEVEERDESHRGAFEALEERDPDPELKRAEGGSEYGRLPPRPGIAEEVGEQREYRPGDGKAQEEKGVCVTAGVVEELREDPERPEAGRRDEDERISARRRRHAGDSLRVALPRGAPTTAGGRGGSEKA